MNILTCRAEPYFEKNLGQLAINVKYKVKANHYTTFFTENKLIVSLPSKKENTRNIFSMKLENISSDLDIQGQDKQIGVVNYLMGNDESKWIKHIPTYSKIKYQQIYEKIDLYYYINDKNLEYDFVLKKGANPSDISISFEGVDKIEINDYDDIVITIGDVKAILLKPEVYQIIDDKKIYIDCKYILDKNQYISFLVSEYEKEYELVLDPVLKLDYSTYIGGINCEFARDIAVDSEGCVYITGYAKDEYPTTTGQVIYGGGSVDAFVTKLSSDGSSLMYSTYLGGNNADYATGIAVDSLGCAYVTGQTESSNFSTTYGAYQNIHGGNSDVFLSKLNQYGSSLIYSTYIGGVENESANAIAIDSLGCAYITGRAQAKYPVTTGAYQTVFKGEKDVFVSKLSEDGKSLIYSTYIGGSGANCGNGIAVDKDGCAYITGYAADKYPTTRGAYQITYGGGAKDAFVSKLSADGKNLIYSTYIGGSSVDQGNAIAIDDSGYAYIVGKTEGSYPLINSTQSAFGGNRDIIASKISIDGSELIYSTSIGGNNIENAYGIAVDSEGYAYITGYSVGDAFFTKLSINGSKLISNVSLHNGNDDYGRGIALDSKGYIYIAGYAEYNYPTTTGAYQTICGGNHDVMVSKIVLVDFDLSLTYKQEKAKLLDIINTKLTFKNLTSTNIDVNIKYQPLDSAVSVVEDSLFIQGISYLSSTILEEIYLPNIKPTQNVEIELSLKYISEKFPNQIPISVIVQVYDNKTDTPILLDSRTSTLYIDTTIGPNYIPGCNRELYNLEISGKLQTTASGIPIIYYKSGNSYVYRETNGDGYVYKVLEGSNSIAEYKISG